jgi:predicted permease
VSPGFDATGVLTMRMSLTGPRFSRTSAVAQVIRAGTERISSLPSVEMAGATCCVPLQPGFGLPFVIEGRQLTAQFHGTSGFAPISHSYFTALRIPLIRGRFFTDRDDAAAPNVAVINEAMARRFWPDTDPLRDSISIGKGFAPHFEAPPRQIVGIVGDVRSLGLYRDPPPTMYVPWSQLPDAHNANFIRGASLAWVVRVRGDRLLLGSAIQEELRIASGGIPTSPPRAMERIAADSTARFDFYTMVLTAFAAVALLLAAIGIYAVIAYTVQQRTREIAIRIALGADPRALRNAVVARGMAMVSLGMVFGIASSLGVTRVLESLLFGVTARDRFVFITVPTVLSAIAFTSVSCAVRRAASINPATTLRSE